MPTTNQDQASAPESTPAAAPAEPSMAEYAAAREAEMRGQKPAPVTPAAAVTKAPAAAATEDDKSAAAATDEANVDGKTATESAPADDAEVAQIEEAHPAKKGIQKRFSEMTAKQKELQALADARQAETEAANRKAEEALAEVERMRTEAAEAAKAAIPVVPAAEEDLAPDRNDFDDPDEYVAALSAHTTRSEIRKSNVAAQEAVAAREAEAKAAQQAEHQAQVQTQIMELHKTFQTRVAEVKPEYPDYDDKVTNNETLVLRNDVFFSIEKSKDAPHILYHIASNPKEAESLNAMNPLDAAIRLGELQAELRIARKPKPTKAAEPVTPVGNRQSPQRKTPNEESMAEYAARREQEMKQEADRKRPQRAGNR